MVMGCFQLLTDVKHRAIGLSNMTFSDVSGQSWGEKKFNAVLNSQGINLNYILSRGRHGQFCRLIRLSS